MDHFLKITSEEWIEIYRISRVSFPSPAWTWARALINTKLTADDDPNPNTRLTPYQAEKIVESFDTEIPTVPFPGLEHGTLSNKLYTLWEDVQHEIDLARSH